MPVRRQAGDLRRRPAEIGFRHGDAHAVRRGLHVPAQEQADAGTLGGLAERIGGHVEVVQLAGLEQVVAAVAVREPPDAVPALDGAQRAGQDAADAAVAARRGVVVLGDRERLVEQPREGQVTAAGRALRDGAGVRAAAGQPPRLLQELRMVDVEVVVHVIHRTAHPLAGRVIGPAVHVGHQGPGAQLLAQEGRGADQEVLLDLRQEEHQVAAAQILAVDRPVQRHRPLGGIFVGLQRRSPRRRQTGPVAVPFDQPAVPGGAVVRDVLGQAHVVGQVALVDQRQPGQSRLVLVGPLRVRIDVFEQVSGKASSSSRTLRDSMPPAP